MEEVEMEEFGEGSAKRHITLASLGEVVKQSDICLPASHCQGAEACTTSAIERRLGSKSGGIWVAMLRPC